MTRPYAEVIGDPIAQSKSPLIHNFWLGKLGIDAEYRACHVRPDELADYFAQRRKDVEWRGCNVTIPHKEMAIAHLDSIDATARSVGAVNTVVRTPDGGLAGHNTDAECLDAELGTELDFLSMAEFGVAVLGTGGAARAMIHVAKTYAVPELKIVARDRLKALSLLKEFGISGSVQPFDEILAVGGLLVNASPLGMTGYPQLYLRFDGRPLVFDFVYSPLETALLKDAKLRGLRTLDGLVLLLGQAALAFARLFGAETPLGVEFELRALLAA